MGNKLRHEGDEVRIKVIWPLFVGGPLLGVSSWEDGISSWEPLLVFARWVNAWVYGTYIDTVAMVYQQT